MTRSDIVSTQAAAGRWSPPAWLVIAGAELRLLTRNRTALLMATATPVGFAVMMLFIGDRGGDAAGAGPLAATQLVLLLAFTVYVTATMTLTARRQELYLKRLRSSAATTAGIVAGLSAPLVLLLAGQVAAVFTLTALVGGDAPARPALLVAATLVGCVTCVPLAFLTAAFTRTSEAAQFTTFPVFIVLVGGAVWTNLSSAAELSPPMLAVPGVAVAQLTHYGWGEPLPADTGALAAAAPALLAGAVVAALACLAAARRFRWEPRA